MQSTTEPPEDDDDIDAKLSELVKQNEELYKREKFIEMKEKIRLKELELDER